MKEAGVSCVRLFEHAWHRFEPREWEFEFDWATRLLNSLKEAGIEVVVATPTDAPPAWMIAKYPEILRVAGDGKRVGVGHRRPYSVVSSRYREFCARIIDQMVHAFRGHEAIVGWQIDHEVGGADYGNEARRAFHAWLHDRFGQIESLNQTWGLEFGSQAFEYFEQVPTPGSACNHPSLVIAFQRFINDQWSSFMQIQCEVVRAGFDKPLSTNMTRDWGMNYFRQNHLLDRVGMALPREELSETLMHLDRMRAEKPGVAFWILGAPAEGDELAARAWLATFSGGEMVLLESWRQPWAGTGMGRDGIVTASGRFSPIKAQFAELARQLKEQAQYLRDHPPVEARIGVVVSNESAWGFAADPPEPDFDYESVWRDEFYLPVARGHYWRDVIDQTADFCPYHVILMPLLPMVFRPTKDRLKDWVREGGCLLLGPLTGHRREEFTAWTDDEFGGLEELMGAKCSVFFSANEVAIVWGTENPAAEAARPPMSAGAALPLSLARGLCFGFKPTTAQVLGRYPRADQFGEAAILMNKFGEGTVITLGARVDAESYLDLIHTLCELAKIEPLAGGSPDVAVIPRMNPDNSIAAYGVVNLSGQAQPITLPKAGRDRLSGRDVGPEVELEGFEVLLLDVSANDSK
jgi:beta-galactosidase GanA